MNIRMALLAAGLLVGCAREPDRSADTAELAQALRATPVPEELREGEALFAARCAACHGEVALGTERGPPLVHRVYAPGHHADVAFLLAVERGVRAHHWGYGDMPPVPDLSRDQARAVTAYVRVLQRAAGIE